MSRIETVAQADAGSSPAPDKPSGQRRITSVEVLALLLVLLVIFRIPIAATIVRIPLLQTWTTVFVSVMVQSMPFLVFGVVLSAVIAVYVPRSFWARALPRHPALAVPVASCAAVVLPGCECGSVPIAGSLMRRGVTPAAALAFLLAAPAINPIVLTATAVAFPNNPQIVVGRGVASLMVAMLMGWLWLRLGKLEWIRMPRRPELDDLSKSRAFWAACRHDIIHAGGFLVIGAMAAATINVIVPDSWIQGLADNPVLSVIALALLAVLLSICSEADAFVAASLSQFSLTSRLVFLVVGPMVDLKLISMQTGVFGRRFAFRFAPTMIRSASGYIAPHPGHWKSRNSTTVTFPSAAEVSRWLSARTSSASAVLPPPRWVNRNSPASPSITTTTSPSVSLVLALHRFRRMAFIDRAASCCALALRAVFCDIFLVLPVGGGVPIADTRARHSVPLHGCKSIGNTED